MIYTVIFRFGVTALFFHCLQQHSSMNLVNKTSYAISKNQTAQMCGMIKTLSKFGSSRANLHNVLLGHLITLLATQLSRNTDSEKELVCCLFSWTSLNKIKREAAQERERCKKKSYFLHPPSFMQITDDYICIDPSSMTHTRKLVSLLCF